MKRIDCVQGDPLWIISRLGVATASRFSKIVTQKTMKLSSQADDYLAELIAEWMLGRPVDDVSSTFMERGKELEPDAISWYEMTHDVDVDRVGFLTTDDGLIGCSPDGLVGDDGGVEVKCLNAKNHVAQLLDPLNEDFRAQIQGCLLVSDREWWDRLYFNPVLPKVERRFGRDEPFIAALRSALSEFTDRLAEAKEIILKTGYVPIIPLLTAESGTPKIDLTGLLPDQGIVP
jgi:hypothetical protein